MNEPSNHHSKPPQPLSPWLVQEFHFDPQFQHHKETIFTIGNGYLSTRGTFEERYPSDRQATLVHGIWDDIPISYTELANAPDWTALELWVNGSRFEMGQGEVTHYIRSLDLQTGILSRQLVWSPDGGETVVGLSYERFASLDDPHILAVQITITPIKGKPSIRLRASLDGHVENEGYLHWHFAHQESSPHQADLVLRTRKTRKTLAISGRLLVHGPQVQKSASDSRGCPAIEAHALLENDAPFTAQKIVGIATSRDTDNPLLLAQDKVFTASKAGYQALREASTKAWSDFWKRSDVRIQGDREAQLALRHALFQLRIAAPTHDEKVSIGAKTLSGFGYRGHVFWDTEIFILPFFTYTQPELARNMLMYRFHTLEGARRKAAGNGFSGAQFAWESAESGDEVTPRFVPDFHNPGQLVRIWTGDIEIHITADIAYALHQYWSATGDEDFWREKGIPILLETACFWGDRAQFEGGRYALRDVIGPDEYHEHVDNNAFTNRMVQWHLQTALDALDWLETQHPDKARQLRSDLDLTPERLAHWEDVRDNLIILQDPETGLFEQFEGFFDLTDIDLSAYADRTQSMQVILGIEGANQHQVIKQPDVLMLLCLLRGEFDPSTWQANWDYYTPRTDHSYGSSLGPSMQAWAACEMSQPEQAYEHFMLAARADLFDTRGNADDGIHAASAGGLWQAVVFGFAGLKFDNGKPVLQPRLPAHWEKLSFHFQYQGIVFKAEVTPNGYTLTPTASE